MPCAQSEIATPFAAMTLINETAANFIFQPIPQNITVCIHPVELFYYMPMVVIGAPWLITLLFALGIFIIHSGLAYVYFTISWIVYFIALGAQYGIQSPRPKLECATMINAAITTTAYGLPDSNLVYLSSLTMVVMLFFAFRRHHKRKQWILRDSYGIRLILSYLILNVTLMFMYWYVYQLWLWQGFLSILFAQIVTCIITGLVLLITQIRLDDTTTLDLHHDRSSKQRKKTTRSRTSDDDKYGP